MDRNRRIILIILVLVVLSCLLAIIDIGLNMQSVEQKSFQIAMPEFGPGVGVLKIYGAIDISDSSGNVLGIESGADAIVRKLDKMSKDEKIKAIVVRINSPGGTVAATQEIFKKIMDIRKKNKIIVASMGDVAASGGYYLASACNYIFANQGTITASIGVIASSPNLKGLFEKLGIKMNVIKSGKYKDILSMSRDLSKDELDLIQQIIDSSYKQFLKDVSLGRNVPISDIKDYADGRVMNGEAALECKLIDGIGTYEDAINKARSLAGLPEDSAVYDDVRSPVEQFFMSMEGFFGRSNALENLKQSKFSMIEYSIEP